MNQMLSKLFFWPYNSHLQLLDAGLSSTDSAFESWQKWERTHDLNDVDAPSFRLLPLVTKNLIAQEKGDELPIRLKGVYRYWWVQNQRLFKALREVSQLFEEAGIPFIFLKGFPIAHELYPDPACRAMWDGDILVQSSNWDRAAKLLACAGWKTEMDRRVWHRVHAIGFKHGAAGLDLHRHGLHICESTNFTEELFSRARPIQNSPFPALTVCDEDQLLIVCVHASHAYPLESVHWMSDLYFLLNKAKSQGEAFDWSRLLKVSQHFELHLFVVEVLEAFNQYFAEKNLVPNEVLDQLRAMKSPLIYQLEVRWQNTHPRGIRGQLVRYARYCRCQQSCPDTEKLNLIAYWARSWDLPHPRHLPTALVRKTWRRMLGKHKNQY